MTPEELLRQAEVRWVKHLKHFNLWQQFVREIIVDRASANVECTPAEQEAAWSAFCKARQIDPAAGDAGTLRRFGMTEDELKNACSRQLRIARFKIQTWGKALPAYFLKRKSGLDRVVYSIVRLRDPAIASELYLRIQEGEATFGEIAAQYSEGPEADTFGLIGPIALGMVHPDLRPLLAASPPGQLRPPTPIGEWHVITRVEKLWAAEFDENIQQQLMHELFESWLTAETKRQFEKLAP